MKLIANVLPKNPSELRDWLHACMRHEATATGLPLSFPTDLLHDQRYLFKVGDLPAVFGWVLCEQGTHLVTPFVTKRPGNSERMRRWCEAIDINFAGQRYYLVSADGLRLVGFHEFSDTLVVAS